MRTDEEEGMPGEAVRRSTAALIAAAALLAAVTALADGDSRKATPNEKEFHARIRQSIGKAFPAAPQGWTVERDREADLATVVPGAEKYPFRVSWHAVWKDVKRAEAGDMAMQMQMVEAASTAPPEKLESVINELTRSMTPRDVDVRIDVSVNNLSESLPARTVEAPPVAGLPACRKEGEEGSGGWREPVTWVFLGPGWKFRTPGPYMEMPVPKGVPSLAVQGIVVRIEADAARTRGIIDKTDWAALKGLLGR
jgi:hypothetical protein